MKLVVTTLCMMVVTAAAPSSWAQCCGFPPQPPEEEAEPGPKKLSPQSVCPVKGKPVDKTLFTDVQGYRVYVCCRECIALIQADPEKYLKIVRDKGETPQLTPRLVCGKCGQLKGTPDCCAKNAKLCKCGLVKGSPGCCKIEKGKDVELCACGALARAPHCCNPGAVGR